MPRASTSFTFKKKSQNNWRKNWRPATDEKSLLLMKEHGSFKITSCINVVIQSIAETIQNFNKAPPMMIMLLLLLGIQHWLVSRWLAYVLLICCDVDDCCFLWHVSWLLLCVWIAVSWRVSWLLLCFWIVAFGRVSWRTTIDVVLQVTVVFNHGLNKSHSSETSKTLFVVPCNDY